MTHVNEEHVRRIVEEVVQQVVGSGAVARPSSAASARGSGNGVFATADQAVNASVQAQKTLVAGTLEMRKQVIETIRQTTRDHAESFSRMTIDETGMGRFDDKIQKHHLAADTTPGVEDVQSVSWTGDHGLTVEEGAPYGVICAITPSTHPVPTLVNNAISLIAAGNTVVFNAHPSAKNVSNDAVQVLNQAITRDGGPANLIACVESPSIESADQLFHHKGVRLILVTGGAAVARAALSAPKKSIVAGPGNPPVVVDETANIRRAARSIVDGAAFDNNVLCIGEKQCFVVDSVADELKREMIAYNALELDARQIEALTDVALPVGDDGEPHASGDFIGHNANVLGRAIGLDLPDELRLLIGETDANHPFVNVEQMMPFLPIVRIRDVNEGIRLAIESEHGYRHTAMIHSMNVENMHNMARAVDTTVFVKNGPSFSGLGVNGEGYSTFSIAGPTGEGLTTARTFTRRRRCSLVDYFRIT